MEALVNAAFPTLPPSAHLPKASLFDRDANANGDACETGGRAEDTSKAITTNVMYGIYPLNEKRGKVRNGFMVLNPPLLELYKSQKDAKANKLAKWFINLEEVFNICLIKEPFQIKADCVSIMDKTDTFYLKPIDSEYSIQNWFEYILEKCRALRSAKFARPVFREEFFEASWDVYLAPRPKLKKNYSKHLGLDDLAVRLPKLEGRRRVCVQATTVLLFGIGATPTADADVPFEKCHFINLPSHVISSYGNQERCFILRTGRFSEIGSGEMYMQCDSHATAKAMHDGMMEILSREMERRKAQGILQQNWMTNTNLRSKKRRDRRENPEAPGPHDGHRAEVRLRVGSTLSQATTQGAPSRKSSTSTAIVPPPMMSTSSSRSSFRSKDKQVDSSIARKTEFSGSFKKKTSIAGLLPSFRLKLGSNASVCTSKNMADASVVGTVVTSAAGNSTLNCGPHSPLSAIAPSMMALNSGRTRHGSSTSVDMATMSAGGVTRFVSASNSARSNARQPQLNFRSANYNSADDYMPYEPRENGLGSSYSHSGGYGSSKRGLLDDASRKGSASMSGIFAHSTPIKQLSKSHSVTSTTKKSTRGKRKKTANADEEDYLQMDENMCSSSELYPMPEAQSFISNSSDACGSPLSLDGNAPRAYSLGAKSRSAIAAATTTTTIGYRRGPGGSGHRSNDETNHERARYNSVSTNTSGDGRTPPSLSTSSSRRATHSARHTPPTVREDCMRIALNGAPQNNNNSQKKTITATLSVTSDDTAPAITKGATLPLTTTATDVVKCDKSAEAAEDEFSELRKRAHSLGSKSWKKPTFLKNASKRVGARFAASPAGSSLLTSTANANSGGGSLVSEELRARTDSSGSTTGVSTGAGGYNYGSTASKIGRQNSVLLNTPAVSATRAIGSLHADTDHVEFDFDRGSCPSIDSPSNRSRNSSLGVQLPSNMRAALDLALTSHRSFAITAGVAVTTGSGQRPSERYLEGRYGGEMQTRQENAQQTLMRTNILEKLLPADVATTQAPIVSANAVVSVGAAIHSQCKKLTENSESISETKNVDSDDYVIMDLSGSSAPAVQRPILKASNSGATRNWAIDTILESTTASSAEDEERVAPSSRGISPRASLQSRRFIVGSDEEEEETNTVFKKLDANESNKREEEDEASNNETANESNSDQNETLNISAPEMSNVTGKQRKCTNSNNNLQKMFRNTNKESKSELTKTKNLSFNSAILRTDASSRKNQQISSETLTLKVKNLRVKSGSEEKSPSMRSTFSGTNSADDDYGMFVINAARLSKNSALAGTTHTNAQLSQTTRTINEKPAGGAFVEDVVGGRDLTDTKINFTGLTQNLENFDYLREKRISASPSPSSSASAARSQSPAGRKKEKKKFYKRS